MTNTTTDPASAVKKIHQVEQRLCRIILGQEAFIHDFLIGLLAGGHLLLEGLPGLGKTQLVRAFSGLCDLDAKRIQFTPDLMPLDITGTYIFSDTPNRDRDFHPGPLFGNLVLADEINRASPKTQSALLEAMQEKRVTVLGQTHLLPDPFWVIATQNPIEMEGTYPLPEAQLDRFLFKLNVSGVAADVLERILTERGSGELPHLEPIIDRQEIHQLKAAVAELPLSSPITSYIARLVSGTHPDSGLTVSGSIRYGASPRAALSIAASARARAYLDSRNTVGFEDVKSVVKATLRHRIILDYSAKLDRVSADQVIDALIQEIPELEREAPPGIVEKIAKND